MKQKISGVCRLTGLLVLALVALIGSSKALADIEYQFNNVFDTMGGPPPAGSAPWVDSIFTDVKPGQVLLTITNVNLTSGEFIDDHNGGMYFNLIPTLNVSNLVFSLVSSTDPVAGENYGWFVETSEAQLGNGSGNNGGYGFKADGNGGFSDINLEFATHSFSTDGSITFLITNIPGLDAADFEATATGGDAEYAAVHVQGLGSGQSNSCWVNPTRITPVPEPTSSAIALIGSGLWGAAHVLRRRTGV
jgi:hypothetical protein